MVKRKRTVGKARKTMAKRRKVTRKSVAKIAKSVVMRQAETKRKEYKNGPGVTGANAFSGALKNNVPAWQLVNLFQGTLGNQDERFEGSMIQACGIRFRFEIKWRDEWQRPSHVKIFILKARRQYIPEAAIISGTYNDDASSVFEGTVTNKMLDHLNHPYKVLKVLSVVPRMSLPPAASANDYERTSAFFRSSYLKLNKKIRFEDNSVSQQVGQDIAVVALAYHSRDAGTIPGNPDAILCDVQAWATLYYKDF
jgi:hypothetical protein